MNKKILMDHTMVVTRSGKTILTNKRLLTYYHILSPPQLVIQKRLTIKHNPTSTHVKTNRSAPKTIKLTDTLENFAKEPQILTKRDHIVDRMDQTIITLLKAVQVRKQDKKKE